MISSLDSTASNSLDDRSGADPCPSDEFELNERLSRPGEDVIAALGGLTGDIAVLGVAGKMGPTLAVMARRALGVIGSPARVFGVARFSDPAVRAYLEANGVEAIPCDLLDRQAVATLPLAPNLIYMAGQKFGTVGAPERTWAMNTLAPAYAAEQFAGARTVCFSTGCVYANATVASGGSVESDALHPVGEYANSCVGRERMFGYHSLRDKTPVLHFRLNYAIDLRYGVLHDIARKVMDGTPIDLTTGHVNVIWQGDANSWALQCLALATSPPTALNITGPEVVSIRALAQEFGQMLDRKPQFIGQESSTALLSNAGAAFAHFGYPSMPLASMTRWVAEWLQSGGSSLDRPTHFEVRDGVY